MLPDTVSERACSLQKAREDISKNTKYFTSSSVVFKRAVVGSHLMVSTCKIQQWSSFSRWNGWLCDQRSLLLAESIFPFPASMSKGQPHWANSSQLPEGPGSLFFPSFFLPHSRSLFILFCLDFSLGRAFWTLVCQWHLHSSVCAASQNIWTSMVCKWKY